MKADIRARLLARRGELDTGEAKTKSLVICAALERLLAARQPDTVFLYAPFRGEVDVFPLAAGLLERDECGVCFPRCVAGSLGRMEFWRVRSLRELSPGAYGMLEPDPGQCVRVTALPDVLVLPGVGFDRQGFRLGYGGGYYDRFLADVPDVFCVGAAFSCQVVASLPRDIWDRPVQCVVTEQDVFFSDHVSI